MRRFDYSFLKTGLSAELMGLTNVITDLRAKETLRRLQYSDTYEVLRQRAIIASVKESNAIEGIVTTDERIREIVAGKKPRTHDEKEIAGYKEALKLIHTEHASLDVDLPVILRLHQMMMAETASEEAGRYKTRDNLIMEYGTDGKRRIRFQPVKAVETPEAMEQMVLAYYAGRQDAVIPSLLLIPCVILDFLCIHPFMDGNGRVSRLLTLLMLYISGYDIVRFSSMERQISLYKDAYYEALEESSLHWHKGKNEYTPFIIFFLQIMYRCYREIDEQFTELSLKKSKKQERVEAVLLHSVVPVSKADILEKLPDISVKTVELVLGRMLKKGEIRKIGTYRNARYQRV